MEFAELPDRLSFSHRGTLSPVLIRFEGGDDTCGFSITEYRSGPPMVNLYGDISRVKKIMTNMVFALPDMIDQIMDGNSNVGMPVNGSLAWSLFDFRPSYRVEFYINHRSASVTWNGNSTQEYRQARFGDLLSAVSRISSIYRHFYNIGG